MGGPESAPFNGLPVLPTVEPGSLAIGGDVNLGRGGLACTSDSGAAALLRPTGLLPGELTSSYGRMRVGPCCTHARQPLAV